MKYFRTFLVALVLAVVCIVPFQPVGAQNDLSTSVLGAPLTPEDVQTFLDEFMSENMESYGVPGLAFVMVKDGELFFSKGYGYADLENQVLFDPEQTIIRAGSMVKTVTALAVMQLVEQGMIDLDTDVNQYLTQLQVPSTYDEPVTARQLLHYTAGFDARFIGIRVENADEIMPLGDYLAEHLTDRVRPPGEFRAYND
ncbi:MAG TPA: serine hydrolase domain-containing protein, partial [Anaerolineales bacterium]|nr:serine hydrolase domain-containing protein [Anaerolineales bacterium]